MNYKDRLYKSEEGYSVSCPGLPGCWSQGKSCVKFYYHLLRNSAE